MFKKIVLAAAIAALVGSGNAFAAGSCSHGGEGGSNGGGSKGGGSPAPSASPAAPGATSAGNGGGLISVCHPSKHLVKGTSNVHTCQW